jgi:hypothetical protein
MAGGSTFPLDTACSCPCVSSFLVKRYGKQSLRRELKDLVRAKDWALGEELFAESKKIIIGEEKNSR